jgi:geranylgeranyl reductase
MEIIDRRVTKMKMISPSNREVDVGKTLNDKEWIGMCRREVRLSGLSALAASRSAVRR